MAKRTTRRSISIKGITYQRLKGYCDQQQQSVSGYLERIIAEHLDAVVAPVPDALAEATEDPLDLPEPGPEHKVEPFDDGWDGPGGAAA